MFFFNSLIIGAVALLGCSAYSALAPSQFASVTNFGDSITCGYSASPADGTGNIHSTQGYAGVLDKSINSPAQNVCRSGDQAADMARLWVYPNATPTLGQRQLYTVMIGTNDAGSCGGSQGCISNWSQSLQSSLAWLALPSTDKILASAATVRTGNWVPDLNIGLATTNHAATLTFSINQAVAGRRLYLAYRVQDATTGNGSALVSVDGTTVATLYQGVNTGHSITTNNGTSDTIFLAALPLGVPGLHNVTLTVNSAEGSFFSLLWVGASTQNYATVPGAPRVVVGSLPTSPNAPLAAQFAIYNVQLGSIINSFQDDGLNITVAPTGSALNAATDFVDLVHPNTAGHAKLAAAFLSVL